MSEVSQRVILEKTGEDASSPAKRATGIAITRNDVVSGAICSVLSISYCVSYAALIFSGPLAPFLGSAIPITFLCAAVMAAVVALGSSLPTMVAGPDSSTSAIMATIAALFAGHLIGEGHYANDMFAPVVLALMTISAAAGLFMIALSRMRGGRAMRYVPYPVIGGLLGAAGWLVVTGALRVVANEVNPLSWFDNLHTLAQIAAAGVLAIAIMLATRRYGTIYALPALLGGAIAISHLAFWMAGMDETQVGAWLFAQPAHAFWHPWANIEPAKFPWHILPQLAGDTLAAVLVTAVSALVNVTAIEVATHREADLERELKVIGWANLASAAVGGYVGSASITRTILNEKAGATGRLSALTLAAITAAAVAAGPMFLDYLPRFVMGGLLLYLGADQLYRWTIASRHRLSRAEYISLLAIIVITAKFGFVYGLIIGTVIGCTTFAYSASRINSIKLEFDGREFRSTLDRDREEVALLADRGREIVGLNLQSYLFFGSVNRLYSHIKRALSDRPECRYLIFDFRLVTGIDSSAVYSFMKIKRYAQHRGVKLVFVHMSRSTEKVLSSQAFALTDIVVMSDLDRALEWCENEVIGAHRTGPVERDDLLAWFTNALGDQAHAEDLLRRCRKRDVDAGAVIVRAGEAARSMYFISEGRVGVMVSTGEARSVRIRSLGQHTMIGEMGLLAAQPRSATLIAETASVVYELDTDGLAAARTENPVLVERLLAYVVGVMAGRLAFANRTIGMLHR